MKTKKAISILLAVLMLITPMFALSAQAAEVENSVAPVSSMTAYQNFLDELMVEYNISGVAYVTHNGRVLCQSVRGMQNTAENKPMTIDTLFPIGSISKQFCAATVLLLQEQGKLSVDDKLSKYFPEYTIGRDITIENLLNMRSGIRDHINPDSQYKGHEIPTNEYPLSNTATEQENQQAILDWLFTQELKFTPDKTMSYSNTNYFLLSLIVEQVSGMSYSDFIKQNIFEPLGMTNSGIYEELVHSENLAENHELEEYQEYIDPYIKGLAQGAGDLVSNAKDMDKWMTALSKGTLLSEESFKQMTTPRHGYGFGVNVDPELCSISHNGATVTYLSAMMSYYEKGLNIFVVTNDAASLEYPIDYFAIDVDNDINTDIMLGDVDSDGDVSIIDATAIQLDIAQIEKLTDEQAQYADTDGDKGLSIMDATEIQLFIAGL
ncbi:MAG: serine hydrolase [Ruminococcus sp.]|nr:serine hydrolase [Ruminococcus sp.]